MVSQHGSCTVLTKCQAWDWLVGNRVEKEPSSLPSEESQLGVEEDRYTQASIHTITMYGAMSGLDVMGDTMSYLSLP